MIGSARGRPGWAAWRSAPRSWSGPCARHRRARSHRRARPREPRPPAPPRRPRRRPPSYRVAGRAAEPLVRAAAGRVVQRRPHGAAREPGKHSVTITDIPFGNGDTSDFVVGTDCFAKGKPAALKPAALVPDRGRVHPARRRHPYGAPQHHGVHASVAPAVPRQRCRHDRVLPLGRPGRRGQLRRRGVQGPAAKPTPLRDRITQFVCTTSGNGYWLLGADGGVFSFGDAKFFGSTGSMRLSKPIVGMASPRANNGYWLVASDGGIFSFGGAKFYGSTGGMHLNQPIVGMAATRSGTGLLARSPATAGSSRSATPSSTAPPARSTSPSRSSAWPARRPATATGSSPPTAASSPSATPSSTAPVAGCASATSSAWRHAQRSRLLVVELGRPGLHLRRRALLTATCIKRGTNNATPVAAPRPPSGRSSRTRVIKGTNAAIAELGGGRRGSARVNLRG